MNSTNEYKTTETPNQRFLRMPVPPPGEDEDPNYTWWLDTLRALDPKDDVDDLGYVAVQTVASQNANDYRPITGDMQILFTDESEYHFVCPDCFSTHADLQWSGNTRGFPNWRDSAERERIIHQRTKGWCEFCDPVFGNGGWTL